MKLFHQHITSTCILVSYKHICFPPWGPSVCKLSPNKCESFTGPCDMLHSSVISSYPVQSHGLVCRPKQPHKSYLHQKYAAKRLRYKASSTCTGATMKFDNRHSCSGTNINTVTFVEGSVVLYLRCRKDTLSLSRDAFLFVAVSPVGALAVLAAVERLLAAPAPQKLQLPHLALMPKPTFAHSRAPRVSGDDEAAKPSVGKQNKK
eukprot:1191946-Prorocentrum_minimum.AAC.1